MKLNILSMLTLLFGLCMNVFAQNDYLPQNKYKDGQTFREIYNDTRIKSKGFSISYGYLRTQFLNARYGILEREKLLTQKYGHTLCFRYTIYPVIIDLGIYQNFYNSNLLSESENSKRISYRGAELSAAISLFPISSKVAKILMPYAGVGYQLSEIIVAKSNFTILDKDKNSSILIYQPIWKAGIMINPVPKFVINLEYKQSWFLKEDNAMNQYYVSIGYRFHKN